MQFFETVLILLRTFLISQLFLTLVLLFIYSKISSRFILKPITSLTRIILISYFFLQLLELIFNVSFYDYINQNTERAQGPYAFAYWLMFAFNYILPLVLFLKFGKRFWVILLVALAVSFGFYAERFIILTTTQYRDFYNANELFVSKEIVSFLALPVLYSFVAIVANVIKTNKPIPVSEREDIL